ncbi:MAG: hypothetical protein GX154_08500 [Clostridiales bacterium]|nr:hypothetical protein [Clostridiales bacterium]
MSQLFGLVKTILELTWEVKGALLTRPEDLLDHKLYYLQTEVKTYSRYGDLLYSVLWNNKNEVVRKSDLAYNRKGKLIQETNFYLGYGYDHEIYEYNGHGDKMRIKLFMKNQLTECTHFLYDTMGVCVRIDRKNNKGELLSSRHVEYNIEENLVHYKIFNGKGEKDGEDLKYFTEQNQLIKSIYCFQDAESIPWEKLITCNDGQGNIVKESWHRHNGELGRQNVHKYDFDRYGNWISRKTFESGYLILRKERIIEYF